ncbi:MAG: hypothetical protein ACP5KY_07015 [Thermoproteus sp.]
MAKRRQQSEKRGGSLLDFLGGGESAERREAPAQPEGVDNDVYSYIASRGIVPKEELFEWGKARGYTTADIMRAVDRLTRSGKVRRRLDDEGRLVYSASQ